jgi:hypothetical protein
MEKHVIRYRPVILMVINLDPTVPINRNIDSSGRCIAMPSWLVVTAFDCRNRVEMAARSLKSEHCQLSVAAGISPQL